MAEKPRRRDRHLSPEVDAYGKLSEIATGERTAFKENDGNAVLMWLWWR